MPAPSVPQDYPPAPIVPPADPVMNRSSAPNLPAEPVEPAAPEMWQVEDEVTRAAKSLAQMFNGQIVSWDDPSEGENRSPEEQMSLAPSSVESLDSDPDGDVPF